MIGREELATEILEHGIRDERGLLTPPVYDLVVDSVPIVCVDIIPVKTELFIPKLGIITRATGPERGKAAILGGRVLKNETIIDAIGRHLLGSFGSAEFSFHDGNPKKRPFFVQEYPHQDSAEPPLGFDPTKHALAMTYLVKIAEPTQVRDEALDFHWVGLDELPETSAYNHHVAMLEAADFLRQLHLPDTL
jgi:ADP-ribose pyrophosphatase YjhB (NUDIX family)